MITPRKGSSEIIIFPIWESRVAATSMKAGVKIPSCQDNKRKGDMMRGRILPITQDKAFNGSKRSKHFPDINSKRNL